MSDVAVGLEHEVDDFESDDDFGDFEEVDEVGDVIDDSDPVVLLPYSGDFNHEESNIRMLIDGIFGVEERDGVGLSRDVKFEFDERSGKIFERLIGEEEVSSGFIWKQSVIYKQMLLNLDIDEKGDDRPQSSVSVGNAQIRNMYAMDKVEEDVSVGRIKCQIPRFETLGVINGSEEFNEVIDSTTTQLDDARRLVSEEECEIDVLLSRKNELLKLASVWDERLREIQADNDLFTSYVENLIGNTQKIRREKRILQTNKGKKSRKSGFRK